MLSHKITTPIVVKIIPPIMNCIVMSSENAAIKRSNKRENTPLLKNLSFKIIYIIIDTKIVFSAESLFFQFKKAIIIIPKDKAKNIQMYILGKKFKISSFAGNNRFQHSDF